MRKLMVPFALLLAGCGTSLSTTRSFTLRQIAWKSNDGRQCVFKCKAQSHTCMSQCGGRESVSQGPGYWAGYGESSGPAGCPQQCAEVLASCAEACPAVSVKPWKLDASVKCDRAVGCSQTDYDRIAAGMSPQQIVEANNLTVPPDTLVSP